MIRLKSISFFFLIYLVLIRLEEHAPLNQDYSFSSIELQSLYDLYTSTNGTCWQWSTISAGIPWNFSSPNPNPCVDLWQGITCTSDCISSPCYIESLQLSDHNLHGVIPNSINGLSHLQSLDLSYNDLISHIPTSLGSLKFLQYLDLAANILEGTIPNSLTQLHNMTRLALDVNLLTGTIPDGFGEGCQQLEYFSISTNGIHGFIPEDLVFLNETLNVLNVGSNFLSGTIPSFLSEFQQLVILYLYDNRYSGTLPPELSKVTSLIDVDFHRNQLIGTIPLEYKALNNLEILFLRTNSLTGTINGELFSGWTSMLVLDLLGNEFSGTIPKEISEMSMLTSLNIGGNNFEGDLPETMSQLTNLEVVNLYKNKFEGSLPCEILCNISSLRLIGLDDNSYSGEVSGDFVARLPELAILLLGQNYLSGSIPVSFYSNESKLTILSLNDNYFSGLVPSALANAPRLKTLYLQNNYFTQSLPASFLSPTNLEIFFVYNNLISGVIPEISSGCKIRQLDLRQNLFTGTLAASFFANPALRTFFLSNNFLTGTLPDDVPPINPVTGKYYPLGQFLVRWNFFTGTIPQSIGNFENMYILFFQDNFFTGSLPGSLSKMKNLSTLQVQDNFIEGSLSPALDGFTSLRAVNCSNNNLSGSIPSSISDNKLLISFDVSENYMRGEINNLFSQMLELRVLFLQGNYFAGSIETLVNTTIQRLITNIDVSGNYLSGSIPDSLFAHCEHLISIAAVENCITGSIPASICNCPVLRSIALDGLHTASVCNHHYFPLIHAIRTYQLEDALKGVIPACLFNMTDLRTLHLSGNGISGSIPEDLTLGPQLSDLCLSHNSLSGSIPNKLQNRHWKNFDLSFNKLNGYLHDHFATYFDNASLSLQVNRLSGPIPESILPAPNIEILQGNLFSCLDGRNSLPKHDKHTTSYQCGSDPVNLAMYLWSIGFLIVVSILSGVIVWLWCRAKPTLSKMRRELRTWWNIFEIPEGLTNVIVEGEGSVPSHAVPLTTNKVAHVIHFGKVMHDMRILCRNITLIVIIILLPAYSIINIFYKTYADSYIWAVALSYVSGRVPAILFFLLLTMYATFIYLVFPKSMSQSISKQQHQQSNTEMESSSLGVPAIEDTSEDDMPPSKDDLDGSSSKVRFATMSKDSFKSLTDSSSKLVFQHIPPQSDTDRRIRKEFLLRRFLAGILNAMIVLTVNILYVYISSLHVEKTLLGALALLVSLYKILWSNIVLVEYIRKFVTKPIKQAEKEIYRYEEEERAISSGQRDSRSADSSKLASRLFLKSLHGQALSYLFQLSVFNNVIAPFLAAALASPNCFFFILFSPAKVSVSYDIFQCIEFATNTFRNYCEAFGYVSHATSYSPPFIYSFQCSSSLLASFADVFMYRYIMVGIVVPTTLFFLKVIQEQSYLRFIKSGQQSNSLWLQCFHLSTYCLPMLLRSLSTATLLEAKRWKQTQVVDADVRFNGESVNVLHDADSKMEGAENQGNLTPATVSGVSGIDQELDTMQMKTDPGLVLYNFSQRNETKYNHLFHRERVLVGLVGDAAVLMTFGTIFPPMAVVICITIGINSVVTQLMIGRFISLSFCEEQSYLRPLVTFINNECKDIGRLLAVVLPTISFLASSFWAFALFDCLGDQVGLIKASWIVVVVATTPAWGYLTLVTLKGCGLVNINSFKEKVEARSNASFSLWDNRDTMSRISFQIKKNTINSIHSAGSEGVELQKFR